MQPMNEILLLIGGGLLAGTVGGLLGLGGGIVLMPLLRFGAGLSPAQAAGTCVLAVFFTTLGGSFRFHRRGLIRFDRLGALIVAGAAAAVVSSLAFGSLTARDGWVDLGVGLVFCLVSLRMILEGFGGLAGRRPEDRRFPPGRGSLAAKVGIGASAGLLPGLLGVGSGGILVPAFTFLLRWPIKIAMGASLVCFCLNALISSAFKLGQGFVDLQVATPVCLGTLCGANLGAVLNGRLGSRVLKLVFGLVFGYVAWKFLVSFGGRGT
jgi:uncharacterized membrane protein YfcA